MKPIAYINVEKRTLEFAEPIKWHTPTVANLDRIPLFTKEALAQPEQEPVAWEQFYPDIGKPQIEQPKVRTGDCLLVGVCASEGHKIQAKQEPWRESASDYERGFIDGMQKQMQSSVDKAVNAMSQRTWVGLTSDEIANMFDDWPFKAGEFARAIEAKLKEKNCAG